MKKEVVMKDIYQVHEHPLATLVNVACQFSSETFLECGNLHINAKSIMGIIAFNPVPDSAVTVVCEGPDAEEALEAMTKFLSCE